MGRWRRVTALTLVVVLTACFFAVPSEASARSDFIEYSIDTYMAAFQGSNFSASITLDWPRVIFQHIGSYLSPIFDASFEMIYLFNDTNQDGYFSYPETTYTSFIDEKRVSSDGEGGWNVSDIVVVEDPHYGALAMFSMRSTISLYAGLKNESLDEPTIADWANLTFWFSISENRTYHTNSFGTYQIDGMTAITANYSLEILKDVDCSGVVLEQRLKAGGQTYLFELLEDHDGVNNYTVVSGRVDETVLGLNYTNELVHAIAPNQEVLFAKDDGTVQAYYRYSSEPMLYKVGILTSVPTNVSYFTTGSGLMLDVAFCIPNGTALLSHEVSLGIIESGFVSNPADWLMDNLAIVVGIAVLIVLIPLVARIMIRRKRTGPANRPQTDQVASQKEQEIKQDGDTV